MRDPENASILILGTKTVIIAAVLLVVLSFAIGYFFGFKGSEPQKLAEKGQGTAPVKPRALQDKEKAASKPQDLSQFATVPSSTPLLPASPGRAGQKGPAQYDAPPVPDKDSKQTAEPPPATGLAEGKKAGSARSAETMAPQQALEKKMDKPAGDTPELQTMKKPSQTRKKIGEHATTKKAYTLQVGAYPDQAEAERVQRKLQSKGFNAHIVNKGETDPYYRVRSGSFADKKLAEEAAASVRTKTKLSPIVMKK